MNANNASTYASGRDAGAGCIILVLFLLPLGIVLAPVKLEDINRVLYLLGMRAISYSELPSWRSATFPDSHTR
jgi:hypothetical protein